ncbi:MAG TPA: glycoside hydrolase family 2 TIM barrel-domain containing protein, partial [Candidatus Sulfopaludibacter sp.]|nr:glycoside hydrolase family 2 TIM barrel-domain containing protein [Candidatus Sulfopaludibacter sp.]
SARGRYFHVEFDGAMSNAHVWINGQELGGRPYGYIGFGFDLTPHLKFGAEPNVLAVRLTPEDRSSRWYPGAGIYRNVWLDVTGPLHVARWGSYVTTPEVSDDKASVAVQVELRNRTDAAAPVTLRNSVVDAAGKVVTRADASADIPAGGTQTVPATLSVSRPHRWDIESPYLYSLVSEVLDSHQKALDRYVTPFGIRSIGFDKARGFLLNGRAVKLQGVCDHSDLGALGMAVNRRATERQLEILKRAGVNAIRTSHNPPSPELLEYCDRMGLVVMDESFDMWRIPKIRGGNDYSKYFDQWSERDVRDMVHRDRNHPSIIMWSIGNEIPEQGRPEGAKEAHRLTAFFHQEDPTRPTTSAFNNSDAAIKNGLAAEVDVVGFNYKPMLYEKYHDEHPGWVIYGSETASCVSSRGVYHLPIEKYQKHPSLQLSSYDIIAPPWAYCPDPEFEMQQKFPYLLGEFVWTGFDYIGEPTPYFGGRGAAETDWPAHSSYFGFIDLAGFPKDRFYLYQSVWSKQPMVHVLPHWNWQAGQTIPVMAYTNAGEVELFLNGKSLGRKKHFGDPVELPVGPNISQDHKYLSRYRLMWQAPFEPGTLKAVAYQNGKQVAVDEVRTAGAPAKVKLTPDRATIHSDGDDLSFVTVRIEDKDGNLCPMADNLVRFALSGPGSIAGVDNGNAATVEPFQADHRKAFSGMALLIVRSQREAGRIHVTATSEGLAQATTDITTAR